jgi:hypothetical protein
MCISSKYRYAGKGNLFRDIVKKKGVWKGWKSVYSSGAIGLLITDSD